MSGQRASNKPSNQLGAFIYWPRYFALRAKNYSPANHSRELARNLQILSRSDHFLFPRFPVPDHPSVVLIPGGNCAQKLPQQVSDAAMALSNPYEGDRFTGPWDYAYSNPEHIPRSYLTGEELRAISGENNNQMGNQHHQPLNALN